MPRKIKTTYNMKADFWKDGASGIFDDDQFSDCTPAEQAQMRFALSWLETTMFPHGTLGVYAPGPVTGGQIAYDVAAEIGVKNIAELPAKLGADEFFKRVIQPNIERALLRGRFVQEDLFPEKPVINPIGAEGSVRVLKMPEFSADGKKWGQKAFMGTWLKVIDRRIDTMVLDNDWSLSNGSIEEVTHASIIQAGLRPCRPDADMSIVNMKGRPVSLYKRALAVSEAVKYGLSNGFEVPVPATSLARLFHIHTMKKRGQIDVQRAHLETFKYKDADMDTLIAAIKPVLLAHCISYMNIKDLGQEYFEAKQKALAPPAAQPPSPNPA